MIVAQGPTEVNLFRMKTLIIGMRSELRGMRLTRKAPSCFKIVKAEYGLKGNKQAILAQFADIYNAEVERVQNSRKDICPVTGMRIAE